MKLLRLIPLCLLMAGCHTPNDRILVITNTTLGVAVAQNPATQLYEAKIVYDREEFAYLPSTTNGSNICTPEMIMELKMQNLFSGGGIYQRLAVGPAAVQQPGAAFMFAKDSTGALPTNALGAVIHYLETRAPRPTTP